MSRVSGELVHVADPMSWFADDKLHEHVRAKCRDEDPHGLEPTARLESLRFLAQLGDDGVPLRRHFGKFIL